MWRPTVGQMLNTLFSNLSRKKKKESLKHGKVKLPKVLLLDSHTDGIWTQVFWTVKARIFHFHSIFPSIFLAHMLCSNRNIWTMIILLQKTEDLLCTLPSWAFMQGLFYFWLTFYCWLSICSFHLNLQNLTKHPNQKHTQTKLTHIFVTLFLLCLLPFLCYLEDWG